MARHTLVLPAVLALVMSSAHATAQTKDKIQSGFGKGAYPLGSLFVNLDQMVEPEYPAAALRAAIQGEVLLEAVVRDDGRVGDVRVVKSLDVASGVDASAVAAVKKWRFTPASIGDRKVAVVIAARVTFHMHPADNPDGKPFTESGLTGEDGSGESMVVSADTPGLTMPMVKRQEKPKYTSEAMREKIQGVVELSAIVGVDGRLTSVRVTKSLDSKHGLDGSAIAAARLWLFTPGRLNGVAVPVRISLNLEFRLH